MRVVGGLRPKFGTRSNAVVEALAEKLGGTTQSRDALLPSDAELYVQHGWKLSPALRQAMDVGIPYVVIDNGYFRDPNRPAHSLSINGFHGLSMVPEIPKETRDGLPRLKPWKTGGEFVYVYGQMQNDRAVRGLNMEAWPTRTAQQASEAYGLPAKIRKHPLSLERWEHQPPLIQTFEEQAIAVTWTTSAAIQTVIHGIPTVCMHPANMAAPVAFSGDVSKDIQPYRVLGRQEWLNDLGWRQYSTLDGMKGHIIRNFEQARMEARDGRYDTEGLRV